MRNPESEKRGGDDDDDGKGDTHTQQRTTRGTGDENELPEEGAEHRGDVRRLQLKVTLLRRCVVGVVVVRLQREALSAAERSYTQVTPKYTRRSKRGYDV